jgi:hypothetical protein
MSNQALVVLNRCRSELMNEIEMAGSAGGTGRAASFAQTLFYVQGAIDALAETVVPSFSEKMALAKAAKAAAK